jgi:hypothetical protein
MAVTQLASLFQNPIVTSIESSKSEKKVEELTPLKVAKVAQVGDVVHVFSHIKKTYRTQWILLEGGTQPPVSRPMPANMRKNQGDGHSSSTSASARGGTLDAGAWVPMAQVEGKKCV